MAWWFGNRKHTVASPRSAATGTLSTESSDGEQKAEQLDYTRDT